MNETPVTAGRSDFADPILLAVFEASPIAILVFDEAEAIVYASPLAERIFGRKLTAPGRMRCGDFIACVNRLQNRRGCGHTPACPSCPVLHAIRMSLTRDGRPEEGEAAILRDEGGAPIWIRFRVGGIVVDGRRWVVLSADDITVRKHTETRLTELLEFNRRVLDSIASNMAVVSVDGTIVQVNAAWAAFAAANGGGAEWRWGPGASYFRPVPDGDPGAAYARAAYDGVRRVIVGELPAFEMDYPCNSPDVVRWFSMRVLPIRGTPGQVLVAHTDITARKLMEEALRRSEEQLSSAMEMAALGHWEYDVAADRFTFNDHFYKLFRTSVDEVGSYRLSAADYAARFVHPADRGLVASEIHKALETSDPGFVGNLEHRVLFGDRTSGHISVRYFITRDALGRTVRTYGVNQDITGRKQNEQALQELQARFHAVINDQTELICRFTADGTLTFVNRAYCRYFGVREENLLGRSFFPYIAREEREQVLKRFSSLTAEHPFVTYEHRATRADGEERWMEWTERGILDAQGRICEYQGVGRDVTTRRELQALLVDSSEREKRLLGQELHDGLCQELKGLEMQIAPIANRLAARKSPETRAIEAIESRINKAVSMAYGLAKGMLPVSLEFGNLNAALRSLAAGARLQTRAAVRTRIRPLDVAGHLQAIHLFRIAQEALNNAVRHSGATQILIEARMVDGALRLAVKDNGRGIPLPHRLRAGMGLAVMRSRADSLQADFRIVERRGGGTEVRCICRNPV